MTEFPLISVIIPAYNASLFVADAINSVIQQTYSCWEMFIVDDGSTDNTKAVVQPYAESDKRIHYLYQPNGKQAKARNNGISHSDGEFIAFLDADDLWEENKLERGLKEFEKNRNLSLIFSQGYKFTRTGKEKFDTEVKPEWNYEDIPLFIKKNRIPIQSVLVKREPVEKVGGFKEDPRLQNAEDYDLWMRLLYSGYKFKSIPDRLFSYRVHDQQSTAEWESLHQPLLTLFTGLYKDFSDDKYSLLLLKRITGFLRFATFREEARSVLLSYVKEKSPLKAASLKLLSWLPDKYNDKLLNAAL